MSRTISKILAITLVLALISISAIVLAENQYYPTPPGVATLKFYTRLYLPNVTAATYPIDAAAFSNQEVRLVVFNATGKKLVIDTGWIKTNETGWIEYTYEISLADLEKYAKIKERLIPPTYADYIITILWRFKAPDGTVLVFRGLNETLTHVTWPELFEHLNTTELPLKDITALGICVMCPPADVSGVTPEPVAGVPVKIRLNKTVVFEDVTTDDGYTHKYFNYSRIYVKSFEVTEDKYKAEIALAKEYVLTVYHAGVPVYNESWIGHYPAPTDKINTTVYAYVIPKLVIKVYLPENLRGNLTYSNGSSVSLFITGALDLEVALQYEGKVINSTHTSTGIAEFRKVPIPTDKNYTLVIREQLDETRFVFGTVYRAPLNLTVKSWREVVNVGEVKYDVYVPDPLVREKKIHLTYGLKLINSELHVNVTALVGAVAIRVLDMSGAPVTTPFVAEIKSYFGPTFKAPAYLGGEQAGYVALPPWLSIVATPETTTRFSIYWKEGVPYGILPYSRYWVRIWYRAEPRYVATDWTEFVVPFNETVEKPVTLKVGIAKLTIRALSLMKEGGDYVPLEYVPGSLIVVEAKLDGEWRPIGYVTYWDPETGVGEVELVLPYIGEEYAKIPLRFYIIYKGFALWPVDKEKLEKEGVIEPIKEAMAEANKTWLEKPWTIPPIDLIFPIRHVTLKIVKYGTTAGIWGLNVTLYYYNVTANEKVYTESWNATTKAGEVTFYFVPVTESKFFVRGEYNITVAAYTNLTTPYTRYDWRTGKNPDANILVFKEPKLLKVPAGEGKYVPDPYVAEKIYDFVIFVLKGYAPEISPDYVLNTTKVFTDEGIKYWNVTLVFNETKYVYTYAGETITADFMLFNATYLKTSPRLKELVEKFRDWWKGNLTEYLRTGDVTYLEIAEKCRLHWTILYKILTGSTEDGKAIFVIKSGQGMNITGIGHRHLFIGGCKYPVIVYYGGVVVFNGTITLPETPDKALATYNGLPVIPIKANVTRVLIKVTSMLGGYAIPKVKVKVNMARVLSPAFTGTITFWDKLDVTEADVFDALTKPLKCWYADGDKIRVVTPRIVIDNVNVTAVAEGTTDADGVLAIDVPIWCKKIPIIGGVIKCGTDLREYEIYGTEDTPGLLSETELLNILYTVDPEKKIFELIWPPEACKSSALEEFSEEVLGVAKAYRNITVVTDTYELVVPVRAIEKITIKNVGDEIEKTLARKLEIAKLEAVKYKDGEVVEAIADLAPALGIAGTRLGVGEATTVTASSEAPIFFNVTFTDGTVLRYRIISSIIVPDEAKAVVGKFTAALPVAPPETWYVQNVTVWHNKELAAEYPWITEKYTLKDMKALAIAGKVRVTLLDWNDRPVKGMIVAVTPVGAEKPVYRYINFTDDMGTATLLVAPGVTLTKKDDDLDIYGMSGERYEIESYWKVKTVPPKPIAIAVTILTPPEAVTAGLINATAHTYYKVRVDVYSLVVTVIGKHGRPLPGAEVEIKWPDGSTTAFTADKEGKVLVRIPEITPEGMSQVPPGEYKITVKYKGVEVAKEHKVVVHGGAGKEKPTIEAVVECNVFDVVLALVEKTFGVPLAGAVVDVEAPGIKLTDRSLNSEGKLYLRDVPAGKVRVTIKEWKGIKIGKAVETSVEELITTPAIPVSVAGKLVVAVKGERGQLLPGATVTVKIGGMIVETKVAEGGKAEFVLPPGTYTIEAAYREFRGSDTKSVEVGKTVYSEIVLPGVYAEIFGVVLSYTQLMTIIIGVIIGIIVVVILLYEYSVWRRKRLARLLAPGAPAR
ncbi:MAG: hypothetical protein DRJ40_10655 [Thermoprotei archaeon]|nr:MAG: hypothetical protein DRJ40_10655 [Thermoprotei archaeon]